jgi:hypothetical protein
MGTRLELHAILLGITPEVYYQPPESYKMEYPCIRYRRSNLAISHANNKPYKKAIGYQLTVISRQPDDPILDLVSNLPSCAFDRGYVSKNLHHDVYNIYY